jgi:hypothetical protein
MTSIWRKRNGRAGVGLDRFRHAILRRPAFHNIGDVNLVAAQAHGDDHVVEQLAGAADEGQTLRILIGARAFANKHEACVGIAVAEDDGVAGLGERAASTVADVLADRLQRCGSIFWIDGDNRLHRLSDDRQGSNTGHEWRGLQIDLRGWGGRGFYICNSLCCN